jgi:hypothetical protein
MGKAIEGLLRSLGSGREEKGPYLLVPPRLAAETESIEEEREGGAELTRELSSLGQQISELRAATTEQSARVAENTKVVGQNTLSLANRFLTEAGKSVAGLGGGGLFLSPILTGLLRLFRGDGSSRPAVDLARYAKPAPIPAVLGIGGGDPITGGTSVAATPRGTTHVTVQVQAMDSKSFTDHRDEIARAVRSALLESHALGDVIREL